MLEHEKAIERNGDDWKAEFRKVSGHIIPTF